MPPMPDGSEAALQSEVIRLAKMHGWLVFRPTPHQVNQVWRTDGRGFPDLTLGHPHRGLLFLELKSDTGRLTEAQRDWGDILERYGEYYVIRWAQLQMLVDRLAQRGDNEPPR